MRLYMRNATLIDGSGAPARESAALLIEGDTVVHAGPLAVTDAPSAGAAQIVDLAGRTVIPGLVEAHIHLSNSNVKVIADLDLNCPPEYSTLVSAKNAELALHCGYTAARSAGSVHAVDVARKHIRVFDVKSDGGLSGGEVWAETVGEGQGAPDGMKIDSQGNVYCCGPGGIHVFSADAAGLGVIHVPEYTANFAWGDPDYRSLYITASTSVYRIRVATPGLPAL